MLLSPRAFKSLNIIEKIQSRIVCALFNCNACTKIIPCYTTINASDETNIVTFYKEQSSFIQRILKQSFYAQIFNDENNRFCLHNYSNRREKYLEGVSILNWLAYFDFEFLKRWENYEPKPTQIIV